MRISIPTLPIPTPSSPAFVNPLANITLEEAILKTTTFLQKGKGKTLLITGAGVSVDSGIRAYRGNDGHYTTNPNYKPIYYHELVQKGEAGDKYRQRYWSRSYLGYPPVRDAKPNPTHMYVAALQRLGFAPDLITQNVDRLHHKASPYPSPKLTDSHILELHGTLHFVHCMHQSPNLPFSKSTHTIPRTQFQDLLGSLNPNWEQVVKLAKKGEELRTNPDGDVDLRGVRYEDFVVPGCPECEKEGRVGVVVKPNVVFFGETIGEDVKERSMKMVSEASQILVLGTSLATYSAFRLIKQALESSLPVLAISLGPSRADSLPGFEKIEMSAGPVLKGVLERVVGTQSNPMFDRVRHMMDQGVVTVADSRKAPGPRAEG